MKTKLFLYALCAILLSACSATSNLPEEELLYRGIKRVNYDKFPKRQLGNDSTGVITALADAYNTVEGLLTGNASAASLTPKELTKEQLDSIKQVEREDRIIYDAMKGEVESVLAFTPNGALMGSSYVTHPFPFRLWIYNRYVNSKSRFGKWMFNHFSQRPVTISTVNPKVRTNLAQTTLRNNGYFRARVEYDTIALSNPRKAKLSYNVMPGKLFHLDDIEVKRFPSAIDSIIGRISGKTLLHSGDAFRAVTLDAERTRIAEMLRNQGYYYYRPDYIHFLADTLRTPTLVRLQMEPSPQMPQLATKRYHIGHTTVRILRNGEYQTTDTLPECEGFTFAYSGNQPKPLIKPYAVRRLMFYRPGDLYRQRLHTLWQEKMSESGLFSQIKADYVPRDTTQACDTLDMVVTATLEKPYDAKLEGRATYKSNKQVGPGISFSVNKLNAFRGGETFGGEIWGSYEWQTGADVRGSSSVTNSYEVGGNIHLTYPRILLFGYGNHFGNRTVSSTEFNLNVRCQNRAGYFGRITFGALASYSFQRRRNLKQTFTPLRLDYELQLHSTSRFDEIIYANPTLAVSMRNQFVPSMEYDLMWNSRKGHKRAVTLHVKEAGAVTSLIYGMAGKPLGERDKSLFGVPFAQFLKVAGQYTHQFPLTQRSYIATRAFLGAVFSYGNSTTAPYGDLLNIGGANSLRAFALRGIGPGSYKPATSNYSYITQMGDLKMELNAEYRFPIVGNLHGAAFIDAGNVWLLKQQDDMPGGSFNLKNLGDEIALGTGVGIRYDLEILVLRFDLGIGIHAPYDTGRSGYYNMPSFGKSLGYHFAIGYPF